MSPSPSAQAHHVYHRELVIDSEDSLAQIAKRVPDGAQVLDLGAGPGVLGRYLTQHKACEVDGIEFDAASCDLARPYMRRMLCADLEHLDLAQADLSPPYAVIICADILEHLRNPERLVAQLMPMLQPDGRLLLSIPNVAHAGVLAGLLADEFTYRPEGIMDATHIRFFTRHSLWTLLQHEGWVITWDAGTRLPWQRTEFFALHAERYPAAIRHALAGRRDAWTYQFLLEARPAHHHHHSNIALQPTREPGLDAGFASILAWSTQADKTFSWGDASGQRLPLQAQDKPQSQHQNQHQNQPHRLCFELSAEAPIRHLRWFPSNRPGQITLLQVIYRTPDRTHTQRWTGAQAIARLVSENGDTPLHTTILAHPDNPEQVCFEVDGLTTWVEWACFTDTPWPIHAQAQIELSFIFSEQPATANAQAVPIGKAVAGNALPSGHVEQQISPWLRRLAQALPTPLHRPLAYLYRRLRR